MQLNCSAAGIATHFVPSQQLAQLEQNLIDLDSSDADVISKKIKEWIPDANLDYSGEIAELQQNVDRIFSLDSVIDIIQSLENEKSDWAQKTLKTLRTVSPTSLRVVFRQIRIGKQLNKFEEWPKLELTIAEQMLVCYSCTFHLFTVSLLRRRMTFSKVCEHSLSIRTRSPNGNHQPLNKSTDRILTNTSRDTKILYHQARSFEKVRK